MGMPRITFTAMLATAALLAGCAGKNDQAAKLCYDEVVNRAKDRTVTVDIKALAASAKPEGDDAVRIQAPIVFDAGLSSEQKNTVDCKVRFTDKGPELASIAFFF